MVVTLAPYVVMEVVGDQLFLLDSVNKQVYSLALRDIVHFDPAAKTITGDDALGEPLRVLSDKGIITRVDPLDNGRSDHGDSPATKNPSRRTVLSVTGAALAGSVAALSMPLAATANSHTQYILNWRYGGGAVDDDSEGVWIPSRGDFVIFLPLQDIPPLLAISNPLDIPWTITIGGRTFIQNLETDYYDDDVYLFLLNNINLVEGDPLYQVAFLVENNGEGSKDLTGTLSAGGVTVSVLFQYD